MSQSLCVHEKTWPSLNQNLIWTIVFHIGPELKTSSAQTPAWLVYGYHFKEDPSWLENFMLSLHRTKQRWAESLQSLRTSRAQQQKDSKSQEKPGYWTSVQCHVNALQQLREHPGLAPRHINEPVCMELSWECLTGSALNQLSLPAEGCFSANHAYCQKCLFFVFCNHDQIPTLKLCSAFLYFTKESSAIIRLFPVDLLSDKADRLNVSSFPPAGMFYGSFIHWVM